MTKALDPFKVIENLRLRGTEAIIGQSRTRSQALSAFLRRTLASSDPNEGALLREPIIEAAHPFEAAGQTMGELAGTLLSPKLVAALDGGDQPNASNRTYCFKKEWFPYTHQMRTWETLASKEAQSVLVTSGTGSGKTECFLVPLLDDLARQVQNGSGQLLGVQAIALYPLNALIASQKERLTEWTSPFGGKIRFGLFNGLMPEEADAWREKEKPEEVICRKTMRSNPPPILVTNITMLEYMLARAKDRPIIEQSKGKLRWIILDEAHTHVGAAAAEITLLIRRVLEAFEVDPSEVRFVATSATIGSGPDVIKDLKRYLCAVSGAPEDRVHVIEGRRRPPTLPSEVSGSGPIDLADCYTSADVGAALFERLSKRPEVQDLVKRLTRQEAVSKADFDTVAKSMSLSTAEFANALSLAQKGDDALAPLRIHNFHRAVPGIWSCINCQCSGKPSGWRYGKIYHQHAEICSVCASPVLEVVGCTQCGEAMLEGDEAGGRIIQPGNQAPFDEFSDDAQNDKEEASPDGDGDGRDIAFDKTKRSNVSQRFLFVESKLQDNATRVFVSQETGLVLDGPSDTDEPVISLIGHNRYGLSDSGTVTCPSCLAKSSTVIGDVLRPFRFGAPSILLNATPSLLEGVEPTLQKQDAKSPPGQGRQLLSFTDSRQGTARLSAKLETDAERSFMRAFVYQSVQNAGVSAQEERKKLTSQLQGLEVALLASPELASTLNGLIVDIQAKLAAPSTVSYGALLSALSNSSDVSDWILNIWQARDRDTFKDSTSMADFLLMRELYRRPKRANSIETLGLAQLVHGGIERLTDTPKHLSTRGAILSDWKDLLSIIYNFWVRTAVAVDIQKGLLHWMSPKELPKWIVAPSEFPASKAQLRWPSLGKGRYGLIPSLVAVGLNLKHDDPADVTIVNEILEEAWTKLSAALSLPTGNYALDIRKVSLAPLENAWQCSETGKVIDRCFRGFSPYAARSILTGNTDPRRSVPVVFPKHPSPFSRTRADIQKVEEWLQSDQLIVKARARGVWSDLNDRSARTPVYFRSAEHSAQQPAARLRAYEKDFIAGELNVLNCSTTMEMGVDIGSVSSVMMTNVPPSVASYRQRVGRAGRRGQAIATAFTLCKDRPLDREVFADPIRFMGRQLAAPRVALDSRTIVQRHINAWLLAAFVHESKGETFGAKTGAFFGFRNDGEKVDSSVPVPSSDFVTRLLTSAFTEGQSASIERIVRGSILEKDRTIFETAKNQLVAIDSAFKEQVSLLKEQLGNKDSADRSVEVQLKRLCDDFLLGHLADGGFLPGHGFPTDVVQFIVPSEQRRQREEAKLAGVERENRFEIQSFPSRSLDIAIREFAPGADVVLDGLVHRSGGVSLNWKRPSSDEDAREIQSLPWMWECKSCGAADTVTIMPPSVCPACGSDGLQRCQTLKPAGFVADWRFQAHTEIEEVNFVKSEPIGVSLHDAEWVSLLNPEFGRVRASRETRIFHKSSGANGQGYAICLECGKAEPEIGLDGLNPLEGHSPLRGSRAETPICLGNAKSFAIRRHHWLLHAFKTDGAELQLEGMASIAAARALISALREALARALGIEPSEMGIEVAERSGSLRQTHKSLFLFDRASGGAGFSVQLSSRLTDLWSEIRAILDCKTPGCVTGCTSCVVNRDVGDHEKPVNRQEALEWLEIWQSKSKVPTGVDRIAENARLCENVLEAIDREISIYGACDTFVRICISASISPHRQLDTISDQLSKWNRSGACIELVIDTMEVERFDHASRFRLWGFANQCKSRLVHSRLNDQQTEHLMVGQMVHTNGRTISWLCRDEQTLSPSAVYGRPITCPVIEVSVDEAMNVTPIDETKWLETPSGALHVELKREFDGEFKQFGAAFARSLARDFSKLGNWPKSSITSIKYQDRYCTSPLTMRLLLELVVGLAAVTKSDVSNLTVTVEVRDLSQKELKGWGKMHNDWQSQSMLSNVLELASESLGFEFKVISAFKAPHFRRMEIEFASGEKVYFLLDQGFGPWATNVPIQFNHQEDPKAQAKRLLATNGLVRNSQHLGTYIVLGQIHERQK